MKLRGRFTLWFTVAALVPIAAAALVTRAAVSRSYRRDFARTRRNAEKLARRGVARLEASVARSVAALASRDHYLVGGLLLDMTKFGAPLPAQVIEELRERAGPVMRGLGLDVFTITDASTGVVLAAPQDVPAEDEVDPVPARRARKSRGKPYFTREAVFSAGQLERVLVVEAAATARDGAAEVAVVGGRRLGAELVDPLREPGRIDARIVDAHGRALIPSGGKLASYSGASFRVPLNGPDGAPVAWIEVSISDAGVRAVLRDVSRAALALAGAALFGAALLGFWVARRMTRDLDRLVAGAQAASRGDLDHRVDVRARDEIGAVAGAFNTMMVDLRESKRKLVIAERIAAWREMARRLAHEIKNPLTPIQMSVETLRRTWSKRHPSFEQIFDESTATVLEETARLKRIVSEFSQFARLPKPDVRPVDVSEVVRGAVALYHGAVAVERDLAADLPQVPADRDQLTQVVLNLLENARDAVSTQAAEQGGRILVRTRAVSGGAAVELVVEDNGPGIPPEARDQLFTPYFTTKRGRGGTGLGLAIVHRIITEHGGRIAAEDAPSGGARFVIELPAAPAA